MQYVFCTLITFFSFLSFNENYFVSNTNIIFSSKNNLPKSVHQHLAWEFDHGPSLNYLQNFSYFCFFLYISISFCMIFCFYILYTVFNLHQHSHIWKTIQHIFITSEMIGLRLQKSVLSWWRGLECLSWLGYGDGPSGSGVNLVPLCLQSLYHTLTLHFSVIFDIMLYCAEHVQECVYVGWWRMWYYMHFIPQNIKENARKGSRKWLICKNFICYFNKALLKKNG